MLILLARSSGVGHDAMNAEKAGVVVLMESGEKTTGDEKSLVKNEIFTISTGAGFVSTVWVPYL